MKSKLVLLLFLLPLVCLHAGPGEQPIITVFNFQTNDISDGEMRIFVDFVSSHIIETGRYRVIERAQRQAILTEIEFSAADCSDEECQLEIGRMLSANQIIVGSLGRFGESFLLTIKLIDVETSQSLGACSSIYTSLDELLADSKNLTVKLLDAREEDTKELSAGETTTAEATAAEERAPEVDRYAIPRISIRVDGKIEDWNDTRPIIVDRANDDWPTRDKPGTDIDKVFLARDEEYLYFRMDMADGPPNSRLGPDPYVEYNLLLHTPSPDVVLRLQTRYDDSRWKSGLTSWNDTTQQMKTLVTGRVRIRGNSFEARYRLDKIIKHVDPTRLLPVQAFMGFHYNNQWVHADDTPTVFCRIGS